VAATTSGLIGHEVVVIRPSGAIEARIDIREVANLEAADIMDFAPGPNGEIYIAAKKIAWQEHVKHENGATSNGLLYDSVLWLLRFSSTGQFLAKAQVKINLNRVHMAVFASGSWLAVGYPQASFRDVLPFWAIIGQDGELVRPVSLPDTVPSEPWRKRGYSTTLLPILGEDGNAYVIVPTVNLFKFFTSSRLGMSLQGDLAAGGAFHLWKHPCTLELGEEREADCSAPNRPSVTASPCAIGSVTIVPCHADPTQRKKPALQNGFALSPTAQSIQRPKSKARSQSLSNEVRGYVALDNILMFL